MSTLVLDNVKVFYGPFDISGDLNQVQLNYGANALPDTTFGKDTRTSKGGLKSADFTMGGLMQEDTDAIGKVLFDRVGMNDVLLGAIPQGNTRGNVAYFFKSQSSQFSPGGAHGELYAFNVAATASGHQPLVRGRLELARTVIDASDETAGVQLGAVSASQRIYCALFVFDVPAGTDPTLDVILESDDNSGFSSATTRISMTQATGATSELKSLAGAVTDDYWRIGYTIGGTDDPAFDFAVLIGIR